MDTDEIERAIAELVGDVGDTTEEQPIGTEAVEPVVPIDVVEQWAGQGYDFEPSKGPQVVTPIEETAVLPFRSAPIANLVDEVVLPFAKIEKACLGCGEPRLVHPAVGFPMCPPCLRRVSPMSWDERMQIVSRRKTIEQVLESRGVTKYGPVADRLHVPALFAKAMPSQEVAEWAARRTGTLVLHGPTGTGKSYQATGALRALIHGRDAHGYLINCAGLSRMSRDEFQILSKAGALALDDFGARMSPACLASAYELIEARHSAMLPLVVTTNITLEGTIAVDERIGSRLGAGKWLPMAGRDRRLS